MNDIKILTLALWVILTLGLLFLFDGEE